MKLKYNKNLKQWEFWDNRSICISIKDKTPHSKKSKKIILKICEKYYKEDPEKIKKELEK